MGYIIILFIKKKNIGFVIGSGLGSANNIILFLNLWMLKILTYKKVVKFCNMSPRFKTKHYIFLPHRLVIQI